MAEGPDMKCALCFGGWCRGVVRLRVGAHDSGGSQMQLVYKEIFWSSLLITRCEVEPGFGFRQDMLAGE